MTTINQEVELIIRRLSGGDVPDDSPYDPDYIAKEYRDAMREDLKLEILQRRQGHQDDKISVGLFVATYVVDVLIDDVSKRAYIGVSENFLSLKHNRGIHDVVPVKPEAKHLQQSMVQVANPQVSAHLPIGDVEGIYMYYLEGMRIFFVRDIKRDKIFKVFLKLIVPAPDSIGNNDPLPVLPENVARIRDIVAQRVVNKFPQDRIADGNPNLRAVNEQPK